MARRRRGRLIGLVVVTCVGGVAGCTDDGDDPSRMVGTIAVELDVRKVVVRSQESLVHNLMAEAVHRGIPEADVVLINGGNLRFDPTTRPDGRYPAGEWTEAMIAELLPFDFDDFGSQMVVTLTGDQLESVFERSVANLQEVAPAESASEQLKGWFLSAHGARYRADLARQGQVLDDTLTRVTIEGDRIVELTVDGVPIDPAATYRVSGNEFIMTGMDGHVALAAGTDRVVLDRTSADMLLDYLESASPVTAALDGRIVIEKTASQ